MSRGDILSVYILKGDICCPRSCDSLESVRSGYVVCEDGICKGVFSSLPDKFKGCPVEDFGHRLIVPALIDLHVHAPQYAFCGTGTDCELLDWLERHAFPEEEKYGDMNYAKKAYDAFVRSLKRSATAKAVVFATIHTESTLYLMEALEKSGLECFVGKVSMDRNSPPGLTEENPLEALESWLDRAKGRFLRTRPILTPRFIPSCSDKLLRGMGSLQEKYALPLQSHLSENPSEGELVKRLCPESQFYGDAYNRQGLFGVSPGGERFSTIMAHCVYSCNGEIELMSRNGVIAAHCPSSNMNLRSGIAPVRKLLEKGVAVGLGSDAAAGSSLSILRAVTDAVAVSKLYFRLVDSTKKPLTFAEAFYLGASGGGFFGKTGTFRDGYSFDALVLDDSSEPPPENLSPEDRLERFCYLGLENGGISAKYAGGRRIF